MERQKLALSSEPCFKKCLGLRILRSLKEQKRKLRRCRLAIRGCVQWLKILFKRRRRFAAADVCLVRCDVQSTKASLQGALEANR